VAGERELDLAQRESRLDFLQIIAPDGRVQVRAGPSSAAGDSQSHNPAVVRALKGEVAAGVVVLDAADLARESAELAERAFLALEETPRARPTPRREEARGLAVVAAAPMFNGAQLVGVAYGGILLNRNFDFVDQVSDAIFKRETYQGAVLGSATLFLHDVRVATTVRRDNGNRALGTRASKEVADQVLDSARPWTGPAFVVNESYLTAYDPLRDLDGRVVGMLYVGRLERPFRDLQRATLLQVAALSGAGLLLAALLAAVMATRLARPIHALVEASQRMQRGEPHSAVELHSSCREIDNLVQTYNAMATALAERARSLNAANTELAAVNRRYMDMLGFVSHELKSPVAAMQNYSYLLKNGSLGPLSEAQAKAVSRIEAGTHRLVEMVRHYLSLSRIENGEFTPVPTEVRVRAEIAEPVLEANAADAADRSLHFENEIPEDAVVRADAGMVTEVLENLVSNAIKYGQPGVIALSGEREGERWWFAVRNPGPGIPEDRRGALFGKFARLANGAHQPRGTGLGLFISKQIVEAHGGRIELRCETGAWVEFRFSLPAV
jgi:two-component system NtrC family sensor kinase